MKKTPMSLEDHIELADELAILSNQIEKIFTKLQNHYPPESEVIEVYKQLLPLQINGVLANAFAALENDYNDVITDDQYEGPLYANMEDRYDALNLKDHIRLNGLQRYFDEAIQNH